MKFSIFEIEISHTSCTVRHSRKMYSLQNVSRQIRRELLLNLNWMSRVYSDAHIDVRFGASEKFMGTLMKEQCPALSLLYSEKFKAR